MKLNENGLPLIYAGDHFPKVNIKGMGYFTTN